MERFSVPSKPSMEANPRSLTERIYVEKSPLRAWDPLRGYLKGSGIS